MGIVYEVHIDTKSLSADVWDRIEAGKKFFANELLRVSADYVPFRTGVLNVSGRVSDSGEELIYSTPYARYLWYGKLMVDPITGKGAFHDPKSGRFWSRPGVPKVLTDRGLNYSGAPLRGPRWVERAYIDYGNQLCKAMEKYINQGVKR